jgi:hypothetical protein
MCPLWAGAWSAVVGVVPVGEFIGSRELHRIANRPFAATPRAPVNTGASSELDCGSGGWGFESVVVCSRVTTETAVWSEWSLRQSRRSQQSVQ